MATRSASTGVLVTLVTFVITTVALLVLSVVLFSNVQSAEKDLKAFKEKMKSVATDADLNADDAKTLAPAAQASGKTMVAYLMELNRQAGAQITGDRSKIADDKMITDAAKQMGVSDGGTIRMLVTELKNKSDSQAKELEGLNAGMKDLTAQLEAASKASAGAQGQPSEAMTKAMATLESLNKVADEYRADSEQVRKTLDEAKREFDQRMSQAKSSQEAEIGSLKSANARLETRLNEAGKKLSQFETKPSDPSSIVDGRVLLCGDAAHVMSPIGGQGMNTGFADAEFAAEALHAILRRGEAAAPLLAAYDRIRRRAASVAATRAAMGMGLGVWTGTWKSALRDFICRRFIFSGPFAKHVGAWFAMQSIPAGTLEKVACPRTRHRLGLA